jgi:hypothetical protein
MSEDISVAFKVASLLALSGFYLGHRGGSDVHNTVEINANRPL